jgi:hypothetical protein
MGTYDSKTNEPKSEPDRESADSELQDTAVEPSSAKGDNPATAGPGHTAVQSNTSENKRGHLNPSAPEDANVTPGSVSEK